VESPFPSPKWINSSQVQSGRVKSRNDSQVQSGISIPNLRMEFEIQFPSPKWRKDSQVGSGKYSQKKRLDIPQYKCYNIVYKDWSN